MHSQVSVQVVTRLPCVCAGMPTRDGTPDPSSVPAPENSLEELEALPTSGFPKELNETYSFPGRCPLLAPVED